VVLHVAAAHGRVVGPGVLELGEDLLGRLSDDVVQDVQPSPVGHAQHNLLDAGIARGLERVVQQGYQRLGAFQAETLLPGVSLAQELLEQFALHQLLEDVRLLRTLQLEAPARPLEPLEQPGSLLFILDVHELHADR
jgi:hypothetical protein